MIATVQRDTLCLLAKQAAMACPAYSDTTRVQSGIHLSFSAQKGTMVLTGSNHEVMVQTAAGALVEEDGSFVMNHDLLPQIAALLPEKEVSLETRRDNRELVIKSGKTVYEILVLPGETYPMPVLPFPGATVKVRGIAQLIRAVSFAVATDTKARSPMNGINLLLNDKGLSATACNGTQYAQVIGDSSCKGAASFAMPLTAMGMLEKLSNDKSVYDMGVTDNTLVFWDGSLLFSTRLLSGEAVSPNMIFDVFQKRYTAVSDAEALQKGLAAASVLVDKHTNVELTLREHSIYFACATGQPEPPKASNSEVAFHSWGQSAGDAPALMDTNLPDKPFYLGANYLAEMLKRTEGEVTLEFDLNGHMMLTCPKTRIRCFQTAMKAPQKVVAQKPQGEKKTGAAPKKKAGTVRKKKTSVAPKESAA